MRAAKKARFDKKTLHELVPLNALSESRFAKLAEKILVEEVKAGHYLFRKGDRDNKSIYLLDGKVNLIDGFRKVSGEVESGTDIALHPIANLQPRPMSAKAARKSIIAVVDTNLLDVFLTCDQTQAADVVEIDGADTGDWMTRILQSDVFSRLPPSKIQSLLMKMRPAVFKAGEVVVMQGEVGDYFYTIHEGRCQVSRTDPGTGGEEVLAELGNGDSFGEDSLVSNTRRNATVTMLTDGTLMQLAKADFNELLKKQLVKHIDCETACAMVEEGAVWLDVRTPDEYDRGSIEDSVNVPLASLRGELSELVFNATYILCCDTGGRSGSAAFMLSHKGFDVYVLEGGMSGLSMEQLEMVGMPVPQQAEGHGGTTGVDHPEAEVIEFHSSECSPDDGGMEDGEPGDGEDGEKLSSPEPAAVYRTDESGRHNPDAGLEHEKNVLLAQLEEYRGTVSRQAEQLELLRGELGESGEKLGELYSRSKADTEEKALLRQQYAALQEEFSQQRRADAGKLEEASARIDELHAQIEALRLESQAGAVSASDGLSDVRAENTQLMQELTAAVARAGDLEEQLIAIREAGSREQSEIAGALQEEIGRSRKLQTDLELLGAENERLEKELSLAGQQEKMFASDVSNQLAEVEARLQEVTAELENVRTLHAQKCSEVEAGSERMQGLEQANHALSSKLEEMQGRLDQVRIDSGAAMQEHGDALESVRSELAEAIQAKGQLAQELEAAVADRDALRQEVQSRLEEASGHESQISEELEELRERLSEAIGQIAVEQERAEALQQEKNDQGRMLESLQEELSRARETNEFVQEASLQQQQSLENELQEVRNELAQLKENSQAAESGLESSNETIQSLENDKRMLEERLQQAEALLAGQHDRVAELEQQNLETAEAYARLEALRGEDVAALNEQLVQAEQASTQYQAGLESLRAEKAQLADELQQQLDRNKDLHDEYESRFARASAEKNEASEELSALQAGFDEIQKKLAAEVEEKNRLQQEVNSLIEQQGAFVAENERGLLELNQQLADSLEEAQGLTAAITERDGQIASLQQEISDRDVSRQLLEEQLEAARERHNQMRMEIDRLEQVARDADHEHQDDMRKTHDELTRKNDNEKELQGQIDRLRKQLEQATLDLHRQRESSQKDLDNIREQLHAERRSRDEERSEMAARQRELKEQLAGIASEHEARLGNHAGALEEAKSAIRAEEQARLRELLEAQAQSEDQLVKLQQELSKAHEEIAELVRNQKDLRQLDVDLLQEQNQQAASTIAQMESQLKQLTVERDSGLEEQNELRERVAALRGELEVARGLINMSGQGRADDVARLHAELDEARKNVEIAVRLRAEAETARERITRQRDQLQAQLSGAVAAPAEVLLPGPPAAAVEPVAPPAGDDRTATGHAGAGGGNLQLPKARGPRLGLQQRVWLGLGVGTALTGLIVLVVWMLLTSRQEVPALIPGSGIASIDEAVADHGRTGGASDEPATARAGVGPVAGGAAAEGAGNSAALTHPGTNRQTASAANDGKSTAPVVSAKRVFRDMLGSGVNGPVMVELPAASFKMGSPGNSLNYDERPRHEVTLAGFSISKHEVTFEEYDRFARATGRRLPHDENWGRGSRPVINISWQDARAYADWLSSQTGNSYRLPTESEWEYAARAGTDTRYWWDFESEGVYANCFNCGSEWDGRQTAPVGSFPANRFGLHDMAGNVQEWTEDCYKPGYDDVPQDGSAWVTNLCTQRSVRGGGYTSPLDSLRSAKRGQYDQNTRIDIIGFRVVRDN